MRSACLTATLLLCTSVYSFSFSPRGIRRQFSSLSNAGDDTGDLVSPAGMKGYYRRPSKAIERGGGFFVPGLEGEKIRVFSASILFILFAINRLGVLPALIPTQQIVSEFTGLSVTAILFIQGLVTVLPFQSEQYTSDSDSNKFSDYLNVLQSSAENKKSSGITTESIARSIVQTCNSISHIVVFSPSGDIVLEFGSVNSKGCVTSVDASKIIQLLEGVDEKDGVKKTDFNKLKADLGGKSPAVSNILGEVLVSVTDRCNNRWFLISKNEESDTKWIRSLISCPM